MRRFVNEAFFPTRIWRRTLPPIAFKLAVVEEVADALFIERASDEVVAGQVAMQCARRNA